MIDHVSLTVRDYSAALRFYEAALTPLGYLIEHRDDAGRCAGFGVGGEVNLWISQGSGGGPVHLAFRADERAAVHRFHEAATAAGGRDNGPPGPRPDYGPTYHAAFVHDPDGNNVEAVCTRPLVGR